MLEKGTFLSGIWVLVLYRVKIKTVYANIEKCHSQYRFQNHDILKIKNLLYVSVFQQGSTRTDKVAFVSNHESLRTSLLSFQSTKNGIQCKSVNVFGRDPRIEPDRTSWSKDRMVLVCGSLIFGKTIIRLVT